MLNHELNPNTRLTKIAVGLNTNDTIEGDDDEDESNNTGEALDAADNAMQQWMNDPNNPETQDRLMDGFQDLLEWQQDQAAEAKADNDTQAWTAINACTAILEQSQAAARKKDTTSAKHLLAQYQQCMQKVKLPPQGTASGKGRMASKGAGNAKLTQK